MNIYTYRNKLKCQSVDSHAEEKNLLYTFLNKIESNYIKKLNTPKINNTTKTMPFKLGVPNKTFLMNTNNYIRNEYSLPFKNKTENGTYYKQYLSPKAKYILTEVYNNEKDIKNNFNNIYNIKIDKTKCLTEDNISNKNISVGERRFVGINQMYSIPLVNKVLTGRFKNNNLFCDVKSKLFNSFKVKKHRFNIYSKE